MNINTKTNKSVIELRKEMLSNGIEIEMVYVDGIPFCVLGYVNEADKQASLKTIESAVNNSSNIYEAMVKLTTIANLSEAAPDEEIEVNGRVYFISYKHKALYNANGDEVCNCNDLKEAIKASLIARVQQG